MIKKQKYKNTIRRYYSNGKLLITGEYAVLDGALSLALPTKFGQYLQVTTIDKPKIIWQSVDEKDTIWFEAEILISELSNIITDNKLKNLQKILLEAKKLNSKFLKKEKGFHVKTRLNFPINWGLGTSSTLINNIANWAKVDAFQLLQNSFGGSGYDIACSQNNTAIHYQLKGKNAVINFPNFNPPFFENLYFIYMNKKQDSKKEIQFYKSIQADKTSFCDKISEITKEITNTSSLSSFENLMTEHEQIIGEFLKIKPVKEKKFKDYFGSIKSLGAWGGDFIMASGNEETPKYFKKKAYHTVIPYKKIIL